MVVEGRLVGVVHVLDEVQHSVGVAGLVVVPGHQLHEVVRERDAGLGVEDGGAGVGHEVRGDHGVLGVAQDALHLALGGGLHGGGDLRVLGALLQHHGQVYHGHVGGGHAEGHAGELAVQGRDDLAHGLGGAGGRGDHVHAHGTTAASPVLQGGPSQEQQKEKAVFRKGTGKGLKGR